MGGAGRCRPAESFQGGIVRGRGLGDASVVGTSRGAVEPALLLLFTLTLPFQFFLSLLTVIRGFRQTGTPCGERGVGPMAQDSRTCLHKVAASASRRSAGVLTLSGYLPARAPTRSASASRTPRRP